MSYHMSVFHSFLWLSNISLYEYITFCLSINLLDGHLCCFYFVVLWLMMLWLFIYRFLCVMCMPNSPGHTIKSRLGGWYGNYVYISSVYFGFISLALGDWPKKTLVWFMSGNILPMLFCRSIMVSCIIFKSEKMTLK